MTRASLRAMATEMRHFPDGNVVCRHGGEITIIAPARIFPPRVDRVERLRTAIAETAVRRADRSLGATCMSFVIGGWHPEMECDGSALIQRQHCALPRQARVTRAGKDC